MGYARAGFEVVGVDIEPQLHYPFEFFQHDALHLLEFSSRLVGEFDAIHASPPCQAYIQRNKNLITKWPKLIEPTRALLEATGLPYVIENVEGAPLINPTRLCGTMFGLLILRHRLFESNVPLTLTPPCNHWGTVASGDFAAVYAFGGKGHRHGKDATGKRLRDPGSAKGPEWSVAMDIDWMTKDEMREAIPPAYTEWIGKQLKQSVIEARNVA